MKTIRSSHAAVTYSSWQMTLRSELLALANAFAMLSSWPASTLLTIA